MHIELIEAGSNPFLYFSDMENKQIFAQNYRHHNVEPMLNDFNRSFGGSRNVLSNAEFLPTRMNIPPGDCISSPLSANVPRRRSDFGCFDPHDVAVLGCPVSGDPFFNHRRIMGRIDCNEPRCSSVRPEAFVIPQVIPPGPGHLIGSPYPGHIDSIYDMRGLNASINTRSFEMPPRPRSRIPSYNSISAETSDGSGPHASLPYDEIFSMDIPQKDWFNGIPVLRQPHHQISRGTETDGGDRKWHSLDRWIQMLIFDVLVLFLLLFKFNRCNQLPNRSWRL